MFHKTRVDLRKWAFIISIVIKNEPYTLRGLGETLEVTKDTVAFMMKRVKNEMNNNRLSLEKIVSI